MEWDGDHGISNLVGTYIKHAYFQSLMLQLMKAVVANDDTNEVRLCQHQLRKHVYENMGNAAHQLRKQVYESMGKAATWEMTKFARLERLSICH